jgi:hypothetical protein
MWHSAFSMRRHGLGLVEVLLALLVIVVAALPLIRSGTTIHHRTYTNEFHVLAAVRARTILSVASAVDFETLHRALGGASSAALRPLDLATLLEPAPLDLLLKAPRRQSPLYEEKSKLVKHALAGRIHDGDRIELRVEVTWTIPAEKRTSPHRLRLGTVMHRPEATMRRAVPLR